MGGLENEKRKKESRREIIEMIKKERKKERIKERRND